MTVPHTFDLEADGPGESVEPIVLSEGALSANHARYLVEQAIEGTALAADDLGRVEFLFDHRRAYNQAIWFVMGSFVTALNFASSTSHS